MAENQCVMVVMTKLCVQTRTRLTLINKKYAQQCDTEQKVQYNRHTYIAVVCSVYNDDFNSEKESLFC